MVLIAGHVLAGTTDSPAVQKEEGKTWKADQAGKSGAAATGSSVVERDKKRYDNKKRAADRRSEELKKADKTKQPAKSGSSVVERDKKRYDAQKRAADRRAAEMKKVDKTANMNDGKAQKPAATQGQAPAMK
jgi:hypothetical protein